MLSARRSTPLLVPTKNKGADLLSSLPAELLLAISSELAPADLERLGRTSQFFLKVSRDPKLWERLYERHPWAHQVLVAPAGEYRDMFIARHGFHVRAIPRFKAEIKALHEYRLVRTPLGVQNVCRPLTPEQLVIKAHREGAICAVKAAISAVDPHKRKPWLAALRGVMTLLGRS